MADIKKNMICLENGMVSVIRHRGNQLEFIKRDGEIDFPVTVDFWEWWNRAVSYIEGDEVDLCFIYDKEYDLLRDDFLDTLKFVPKEKSVWDIKYIKSYFWELKPIYFNICLIGKVGQECILGENKVKGVGQKIFYTNLDFPEKEQVSSSEKDKNISEAGYETESSEERVIDDDELSPIAKYFVDLIRKERGL